MKETFNVIEYVNSLGEELILAFNKSKLATHTVANGSSKEKSVIDKLKDILPKGIDVGKGFVYDSFGNVSNQCDIVIYEKDFCIKLSLNGDEENCYYNCESVIAVGEIKSCITSNELIDCCKKFINLNKLKRYIDEEDLSCNRQYMSKMTLSHNFNNVELERTPFDRIYKFILCEKISLSFDKILKIIKNNVKSKDELFNTLLDLKGRHILFSENGEISLSPYFCDTIFEDNNKNNFTYFIYHLIHFINNGTTTPLNYGVYFKNNRNINVKESYSLKEIIDTERNLND